MKHYTLFITFTLGIIFLTAHAQNRVGIGTNAPAYNLDVQSPTHSFGQFKALNGYAGVILDKSADANNAYVIYRTNGTERWVAGMKDNNNYTIANWPASSDALTISLANNFTGLGVPDPAFRLDVGGRMRLRTGDGTAGIWLNNNANTASIGFIGVSNDNHIGLWGNTGIGWSVVMNTDNGYLGVRNNDPQSELHVVHQTGNAPNFGIRLQNGGGNNQHWSMYTVNISGAMELYHNGAFRGSFDPGSGAYTAASDARVKKNIQSAEAVLGNIMNLGVKRYQFIKSESNRNYYGLIAQDVERVFPELVFHNRSDDGKEYYSMDYSAFGVIAIKGLQELKPVQDKQQAEIDQLKQENKLLQQQLDDLKQKITVLSIK